MSRKLSGQWMRLERVERILADRAEQKELVNCICKRKQFTMAMPGQSEAFAAEMNRICPVHGFRHLGIILRVTFVATEITPEGKKEEVHRQDAELDQLLKEYNSRRLAWRRGRSGPSSWPPR